jgi:pimeloyl-ACP methyl ester carboxylesterase
MTQSDSISTHQGQFVEVNGLNMYYQEYGSGRPLILIHGGAVTSNMWQPFLPSFVPHFRVITPDSRGHGKTNNPNDEQLSYHLMADDVAAFIQALNLSKPLVFGYSDGGQIALEIGMRYPGLTGALVLGATWYKFSETYLNWLKALGFEKSGVVKIEEIQRNHPNLTTLLKTEHVRADDYEYWKTLRKQYSFLWWTPRNYTANDFHKITEPTLILVGDRDELIELEQAIEMYRLIPNSELVILPNSKHSSPNVKLLQSTVTDFFLRHITAKKDEPKPAA